MIMSTEEYRRRIAERRKEEEMNHFELTLEYGGLAQQRTHGDIKVIMYGAPYDAPLILANLGQVAPGTMLKCRFEVIGVVDKETGELE